MFSRKNRLDEMQEQKLLHIEKNSFWFLYWILIIAVCIQFINGAALKTVAAELVCFLAASVFMLLQCVRNGIWDRHLKPDWKTNLAASVIAGIIVACLQVFSYWMIPERWSSLRGFLLRMFFCGAFTFIATFLLMSMVAGLTKRRNAALEQEDEG